MSYFLLLVEHTLCKGKITEASWYNPKEVKNNQRYFKWVLSKNHIMLFHMSLMKCTFDLSRFCLQFYQREARWLSIWYSYYLTPLHSSFSGLDSQLTYRSCQYLLMAWRAARCNLFFHIYPKKSSENTSPVKNYYLVNQEYGNQKRQHHFLQINMKREKLKIMIINIYIFVI